jgi:hypothetical protein
MLFRSLKFRFNSGLFDGCEHEECVRETAVGVNLHPMLVQLHQMLVHLHPMLVHLQHQLPPVPLAKTSTM